MYEKCVYDIVSKIPKGFVATYGDIQKMCNLSTPRIVGRILHKNTDPIHVPCHRVVFSDGSLAPSYAFGGLITQMEKLQYEGVLFKGMKVDLQRSRWKPMINV